MIFPGGLSAREWSDKHAMSFDPKEDMTKQSFKDECDINKIIENMGKTGLVSSANTRQPFFGDVSNIPDFMTAQQIVINANVQFAALPAEIRRRFNNDPAQLVEFVKEPANKALAQSLGLLPADPVKEEPKSKGVVEDLAGAKVAYEAALAALKASAGRSKAADEVA